MFRRDHALRRAGKNSLAVYDAAIRSPPLVLPGTYQLRLTLQENSQTATFEVKMDPRARLQPKICASNSNSGSSCATQDELNKAVHRVRDTRAQLKQYESGLRFCDPKNLSVNA